MLLRQKAASICAELLSLICSEATECRETARGTQSLGKPRTHVLNVAENVLTSQTQWQKGYEDLLSSKCHVTWSPRRSF